MNQDYKANIKVVKKIAEELIKKISPDAEISVLPPKEDGLVVVDVKTIDAQTLIGANAETLLAVQHLVRVIARKNLGDSLRVELDVNNYRKKRKEYLKELALNTANEVALVKREVALSPMTAYERRIIHVELSERLDVATESRGAGASRKVVVKPAVRK